MPEDKWPMEDTAILYNQAKAGRVISKQPLRFVTCNCPVGAKYHALNCPSKPGQLQNIPTWAMPKKVKS